ncbi:MAG TPA: PAS domain-containing protein [Crinalium sp.]
MVDKNNLTAAYQAHFSKLLSSSASLESRQYLMSREYADAGIIQLAAFLRDNPNPILVFNPEGAVIKINPTAVKLLKRLQVEALALLPPDHPQIVKACLEREGHEHTIEVTVNSSILALTYRSLLAFKIVYLYAIELTDYRRSEAELLRIAAKTIDLAKDAVVQVQALRKTLPKATMKTAATHQGDVTNMFVSMDGCVFESVSRGQA